MTTLPRLSILAALSALLLSSSARADQAEVPVSGTTDPATTPASPMVERDSTTADHGTRFSVGAFLGAAAPSETFGVNQADVTLDQGFLVGGRAALRIARRFEVEIEGTLGRAGVRDTDESATVIAGRASLRGTMNPDADASLFALVGLGVIAALDAEPLVDETARAAGHYGLGVAMGMGEITDIRLELRHVIGRGSDDGLASQVELHVGAGFAF